MALCLVHLSDIHFGEKNNSVEAKIPHIAAAITSVDTACHDYLLVVSGDIAYRGVEAEYQAAKRLLASLRTTIIERLAGSTVRFLAVPGNHDCILPDTQVALRAALVEGIKTTLHTKTPDPGIIDALLEVQRPFFEFSESLGSVGMSSRSPICASAMLGIGG
jgi:predicted MPP superfamily phosphohydrolase